MKLGNRQTKLQVQDDSPITSTPGQHMAPGALTAHDFGIRPGARPMARHVWPRTREGRISGLFSSHKCVGPAAYESLLERDFHVIANGDHRIERYAVQAHQLTYWLPSADGGFTPRIFTPDFVLQMKSGQVVVVEVKARFFAEQPYWRAREPYIREAYTFDYALPFIVLTEDEIRAQPRLSNLQEMLRAGGRFVDLEARTSIRDLLANVQHGVRIKDLLRPHEGDSFARLYAALMSLALRGEVEFGPGKLGPETTVTVSRHV